MATIWAESVARSLDQALDLLASAVRECPEALWETPMWPVPEPHPEREILGPDGEPVSDARQRASLVQQHSTPWSVAWHALECFDYDLNGEFSPWQPPPPFTVHAHWRDLTSMEPWAPADLLRYIEYCRGQAAAALSALTDEQAARPLPPAHRYHGQPHAWVITGMVGHTTEHAAQIRQFVAWRS